MELALNEWIEYVSFWALAKKNIENREQEELNYLYELTEREFCKWLKKDLLEKSIKFKTVWDLNLLPTNTKKLLEELTEDTKHWEKMTLIIAIWYGWQDEIVRWVKNFISKNKSNLDEALEKLNENTLFEYLDTGDFPAPDMIVRTGWDTRLSWYFLYASEYSEYYFTDTFWPDFSEKEFYDVLDKLGRARRNFGK